MRKAGQPRRTVTAGAVTGLLAMLALLASTAEAAAALRAATNNSKTYTVPAGSQEELGPVISSVMVSSDDTTITFQVNTPNRPSFTSDMDYRIYVDNDNTPSTGNQNAGGADTLLRVSGFAHPTSLQFYFWDGTQWGAGPVGSGEAWTYSGGLTVTVPRSLVEASDSNGRFPTIRFGVEVWSGVVYDSTTGTVNYLSGHANYAPEDWPSDLYSYDFEPGTTEPPRAPAAITASKFKISKARAGSLFTASMVVTDSHSGRPAIDVDLTCLARVANKVLPTQRKSVSSAGRATCSWRLPRSSHGKQLKGTITTSFPGYKSATRAFSTRIP